jgi:hypothetical protein
MSARKQPELDLDRTVARLERVGLGHAVLALGERLSKAITGAGRRWYNLEHRHSGIRFVTLQQRHAGEDHALLAQRHTVYEAARARQPARWSRHPRDWTPVGSVWLNPPRRRQDPSHAASAHVDE